jgi:hypothetical protein
MKDSFRGVGTEYCILVKCNALYEDWDKKENNSSSVGTDLQYVLPRNEGTRRWADIKRGVVGKG